MAYGVSSNSAQRARKRKAHRRGDRTLTRNAALTGVALASVSLAAAGAALFGNHRDFELAPGQPAGPRALQIALIDAAPPPVAWRDPRVALRTPGPHVLRVAVRSIPLPRERPERFAPSPPPLLTLAEGELTGSIGQPAHEAVDTKSAATIVASALAPSPRPSPPRGEGEESAVAASADVSALAYAPVVPSRTQREERVATLMSYAPSREMVFENDVTGSIGNAAHERFAALPASTDAPSSRPSAQSKSDVSDFDHLKLPNSGKPEFGRREGEEIRAAAKAANETVSTKPVHTAVAPHKPTRKLTPFEKLYGPVRVASLTPNDTGRENDGGNNSGLPRGPYDRHTAVYVLAERTVYLPDGRTLEAHSGYGDKLDDARYVAVRMRGATPPHMYDLSLRESLFHGVEAIRLNPVGGDEAIFGRAGLLAHTYMLGANGQSNGCVSFRNYEAFLRAYKSGEISRLAVIARLD